MKTWIPRKTELPPFMARTNPAISESRCERVGRTGEARALGRGSLDGGIGRIQFKEAE